jgi:hypothetical protein
MFAYGEGSAVLQWLFHAFSLSPGSGFLFWLWISTCFHLSHGGPSCNGPPLPPSMVSRKYILVPVGLATPEAQTETSSDYSISRSLACCTWCSQCLSKRGKGGQRPVILMKQGKQ